MGPRKPLKTKIPNPCRVEEYRQHARQKPGRLAPILSAEATSTVDGQVSWLRFTAFRPSHPSRDSGYAVGSPIQWRDHPGFAPGSLFSPTLAAGGTRLPYGLVPCILADCD